MLTLRNTDISPELLKEQGVISVESRTVDASNQHDSIATQYGFVKDSLLLTIRVLSGTLDGRSGHIFYPLIQLSENVYAKNALVSNVEYSIDGDEVVANIRVSIHDHNLVDTLDIYL